VEFHSFAAGGAIAEGVGAAEFGAIAHLAQHTVAEEEGRENRPNEEADWRSPRELADRGRAGWERHGTGRAAASSESGVVEGDGEVLARALRSRESPHRLGQTPSLPQTSPAASAASFNVCYRT